MVVSIDEARHAARLARLALSDDALETLASDLSVVLDHFESVAQCASAESVPSNTAPSDGASGQRSARTAEPRRDSVVRPDTVGAMLSTDEALHNAPESEDGQFSVPGFLPDEP